MKFEEYPWYSLAALWLISLRLPQTGLTYLIHSARPLPLCPVSVSSYNFWSLQNRFLIFNLLSFCKPTDVDLIEHDTLFPFPFLAHVGTAWGFFPPMYTVLDDYTFFFTLTFSVAKAMILPFRAVVVFVVCDCNPLKSQFFKSISM